MFVIFGRGRDRMEGRNWKVQRVSDVAYDIGSCILLDLSCYM